MLAISSRRQRPLLLAVVLCEGTGNFGFWATVVRALGPALQLFRIESERLELSVLFGRRIMQSLDADAAGQAACPGCPWRAIGV